MAIKHHLDIINQGVDSWNKWRVAYPNIRPDLSRTNLDNADLIKANLHETNLNKTSLKKANLTEADISAAHMRETNLSEANLENANLSNAHISKAYLGKTNFRGANLIQANLNMAILYKAVLTQTNLTRANLSRSDLTNANFSFSNLTDANLMYALLVGTNFQGANLTGCSIYAISAWDLKLMDADQSNLIITQPNESTITIDNLEVAQFIYLLLNNEKLRDIIDTITSKVVLILGRFTPTRKETLDAIRDALREHNYLPILFDFDKPTSRDITETVSTLAHLARFVIADITEAKSIPQELQSIIPNLPSVPLQPLLRASEFEYGMFEHFKRYPWVLETYNYKDTANLVSSIREKVIMPAEAKARELQRK